MVIHIWWNNFIISGQCKCSCFKTVIECDLYIIGALACVGPLSVGAPFLLDRIKSILDSCGRSDVWLNQKEITATTIVGNQISKIISDMWLQWWHSEIGVRSRCTYKANPQMELYITELQTKDIVTFAKFRCRYNHLPIASFTNFSMVTLQLE